jgi:hypothetical protein
MIRTIKGCTSTASVTSIVIIVILELLSWVVRCLSLSIFIVDIISGEFFSARWTGVMLFQPWHYASLMEFMIAG